MDESGDVEPMAQARVAAGVLFFDDGGRVLLVRPSYKPGWEIPGGYLHPGESPADAAAREVAEELGIEPPIGRLLVVDWAPHPDEGDKILFVFDGGRLRDEHVARIRVDVREIVEYGYYDVDVIGRVLIGRVARRVHAAVAARVGGGVAYLECGRVAR